MVPVYFSFLAVQTTAPSILPLPQVFQSPTNLLAVVLLVGFATAGFVQWRKDILHWRRNFHREFVKDWVRLRASDVDENAVTSMNNAQESDRKKSGPSPYVIATDDLERLSGGDRSIGGKHEYSLPAYALPAEQLCGQIASAAEITVAAPDEYPQLFRVLTAANNTVPSTQFGEYVKLCRKRHEGRGKKKPEDAQAEGQAEVVRVPPTPGVRFGTAKVVDRTAVSEDSDETSESEDPFDSTRYGELRAIFMTQAQRAIDNLQIALGERWRAKLTIACFEYSFGFGALVVLLLYRGGSPSQKNFLEGTITLLVVTLAGALVAPAAHDVMRAVRSFRR